MVKTFEEQLSFQAVSQLLLQTLSEDKVTFTCIYSICIKSYIEFGVILGYDSTCFLLAWT